MNTNQVLKNFIESAQESSPILLIGLALVVLSSVITIVNAFSVLRDTYYATPLGTKNQQLERISLLTAGAHIEYFKEKLGQPVFANTGTEGKQYVFYSKNFIVQALTSLDDTVIAYSVTTRRKDFNPSIQLGPYSEGGSGVKVQIGKTTFSELDALGYSPSKVTSEFGAHDYYYGEQYYFGNPGLYQTYIFSLNQAGDIGEEGFPPNKENPEELADYRKRVPINTYTITEPLYDEEKLDLGWAGPVLNQVRIIPDFYNK